MLLFRAKYKAEHRCLCLLIQKENELRLKKGTAVLLNCSQKRNQPIKFHTNPWLSKPSFEQSGPAG